MAALIEISRSKRKSKGKPGAYLRILVHQGSYKDECRKVVSWFSLRQDASEKLLKKWGHRYIFGKKMVRGSLKNTLALMVKRNYGSNYKIFFFVFEVGRINSSSS